MSLINLEYQQQHQIAIICLSRPEVHHAIDDRMMDRLENILDELYGDDRVKVIIITATGTESFCAGGDLKFFTGLTTREQVLDMSRRMQGILDRLWTGNKTVIAAVNGQALGGGCEIIGACHLRITGDHVRFSFRQAANGIITGWGGGVRLLQSLGRRALYMLLTSAWVDANRALQLGFTDLEVAKNELMPVTLKFARKIAAVKSFLELHRTYFKDGPDAAIEFETNRFADLWMKPDFRNWLKNYLNSRDIED